MDKKEEFKEYVRKNPSLINYVRNEEMSWQKFYEIYDLYGEDEEAWRDYTVKEEPKVEKASAESASFDFMGWIKNINIDNVQEGMNSVQRVLGLLGDVSAKDTVTAKPEYKPRPLYKHFED